MTRSLADILRAQRGANEHLSMGAVIGRVKNNRDPENLGRVQLEFEFDWQGSHHLAWALPVYPLSGDLGMDVPEEGDLLVCLFQNGSDTQPFYIGRIRGRPSGEEAQALTQETRDYVRLAAAEEVEKQFGQIMDYLRTHTHTVTVSSTGVGNMGAPVMSTGTATTTPPRERVPDKVETGVRRVRLTPRCKPEPDNSNFGPM